MPPLFVERVPPPHVLAYVPVPPPSSPLGAMPPIGPCPPPAVQAIPEQKTFVLEATMKEVQANGQAVGCMKDIIEFRPVPHFHCNAITGQEAGKEYRKWLLMVKATPLKNERVRLEVVNVQGKADQEGNGKVALDLNATPIVDRKVNPGETVKKVLEKDEHGKPRKWLELIVKEVPQAPRGAVWPPPAEASTLAPVPTAIFPMPCPTAPVACQLACPGILTEPAVPLPLGIPPSPSILPSLTAVAQNAPGQAWRLWTKGEEAKPLWFVRQGEEDSSWNLRPIVEQGKSKLIVREGDRDSVTSKSLVVMIPGNDSLKLTACGSQIRARSGSLHAHADKVSRTGEAGCFLFEGHVKLTYKKEGELAKVTAERVFVNLADGCIEIQDVAVACPVPPLDE
jgi:hypothetical protein